MGAEVWTLWLLVLGQMLAITLLAKKIHSRPVRGIQRQSSPSSPINRVLTLDDTHWVSKPNEESRSGSAFLVVSPTCEVCEGVLDSLTRDAFVGFTPSVIVIDSPDQARMRFASTAKDLGAGLAATTRPDELGVTQVPFLIVTGPDKTIVLGQPIADVYDLQARLCPEN